MGQIWDFLILVSVNFGCASQNVLKPDLKKSLICPIWAQIWLTFGPNLTSQTKDCWTLYLAFVLGYVCFCPLLLSKDLNLDFHNMSSFYLLSDIIWSFTEISTQRLMFYRHLDVQEKKQVILFTNNEQSFEWVFLFFTNEKLC